jgi:hypothetical protein
VTTSHLQHWKLWETKEHLQLQHLACLQDLQMLQQMLLLQEALGV